MIEYWHLHRMYINSEFCFILAKQFLKRDLHSVAVWIVGTNCWVNAGWILSFGPALQWCCSLNWSTECGAAIRIVWTNFWCNAGRISAIFCSQKMSIHTKCIFFYFAVSYLSPPGPLISRCDGARNDDASHNP